MFKRFVGMVLGAFAIIGVAFAGDMDKVYKDDTSSKAKALDLTLDRSFVDAGVTGIGVGIVSINGESAYGIDGRYAITDQVDVKSSFVTNGDDKAVGAAVIFKF